jgi:hypothetical protein
MLGTINHMGDFDECLEVNVKEDWGSFKGQYCLAEEKVKIHLFRNQVCLFVVATVAVTGKQSLGC